jgi:FKBP-type peptidyl-prolyl cis-trans isomerase
MNMKSLITVIILLTFSLMIACKVSENNKLGKVEKGWIAMDNGLTYQVITEGTGSVAATGNTVVVHYTGTFTDGRKFDSSVDSGRPFSFQLGAGRVIRGWDIGVVGMRIGEKRILNIPSELAYGSSGAGGGIIPPDTDLVFEVELLEIK